MRVEQLDVLVVGAGPSGLMAGVCLARLGVRVLVVDAKDGPTRESRALALQARSVEIYDQLGLAPRVLAASRLAPQIVPGSRSRTFAPFGFTGAGRTLTPYPGIRVLEQSRNEEILGEAYHQAGGDVRWGHRLVALRVTGDPGIVATLRGPDGDTDVRARWCIGADGASSTVRGLAGIPFAGTTSPLTYYVADALDATGLVEDAVNLRVSPDDFLLTFPMGGPGHHRLLGVVDADEGSLEARVRRRLADEFGVEYTASSWFATYRVHHRLAGRFRAGPVFLVGDAAHVHSPVGAQGMNTGLQDAHHLALTLGDVVHGRTPESALDHYEAERRPVARSVVRTTDRVFARVTSGSRLARFTRGRVVPLVAPLAVRLLPRLVGSERLYGLVSQTRIRYDDLTLPDGGRSASPVGRRLPWTGENFVTLRSLDWQVHRYGPARRGPAVAERLGVTFVAFRRDPYRRLDPALLYLVRPDGFVAAAADDAHAVAVFRRRIQGRPEP